MVCAGVSGNEVAVSVLGESFEERSARGIEPNHNRILTTPRTFAHAREDLTVKEAAVGLGHLTPEDFGRRFRPKPMVYP